MRAPKRRHSRMSFRPATGNKSCWIATSLTIKRMKTARQLRGAPPKVVWIRIDNCTTAEIVALLLDSLTEIERFVDQNEATFLELGRIS